MVIVLRLVDLGFDIQESLKIRKFTHVFSIFQCGRASMETLTLARYVLEMSLMDYELISLRESEVAAASLLVALKMKKAGDWVSFRFEVRLSSSFNFLSVLYSFFSYPEKNLHLLFTITSFLRLQKLSVGNLFMTCCFIGFIVHTDLEKSWKTGFVWKSNAGPLVEPLKPLETFILVGIL